MAPAPDIPLTAMNGNDELVGSTTSVTSWADVADKHWLQSTPSRVKPEVIKTVFWDALEQEQFSPRSLSALENLQIVERFLWPTFSADASNQHVLLLAVFFNVKQRQRLVDWALYADRPELFSSLFRRILSLNLDPSLSSYAQLTLLNFVVGAFQSLENEHVRKECAPLVSVAVWHNMHSEAARERVLDAHPARRKAWRASQRRFDAADPDAQSRLRFDRAWLYSMLLAFLARLQSKTVINAYDQVYCERFVEFLIDLVSQIPTRRYTNPLLYDLNLLPVIRTTKHYNKPDSVLLRDLVELLDHFQSFAVDDQGSSELTAERNRKVHYDALAGLQRIAFQHFGVKLKVLALANYASISNRSELHSHFSNLNDDEILQLCELLGFRTSYPTSTGLVADRPVLMEVLLHAFSKPPSFHDIVEGLSVMPTENNLYDPRLLLNDSYDGSKPIASPKLNLQYLTLNDFMWRSFKLYQAEAFYGVRKDLESTVKRLKPRRGRDPGMVAFDGFTKMAIPIDKPAIIEVGPPRVGSVIPSFVRAEIILDVSRLTDNIQRDWDSLKPKDTIFLLAVRAPENPLMLKNDRQDSAEQPQPFTTVRSADVWQTLDENGRTLRNQETNGHTYSRPRRRRLLVDLDPVAYQADKDAVSRGNPDVYPSINVIVRRQARENNFKPILETVQNLVSSQAALPPWLQDLFLGYGDPKNVSAEKVASIDYVDTFQNWEHLVQSFPAMSISSASGSSNPLEPPYVLEISTERVQDPPVNPKKRRRDQMEQDSTQPTVTVTTYKPKNTGPYTLESRNKNGILFTPKQIASIASGVQPGLSVIVGPPGTGKTDVATQIINLLYHNFPSERILLIAHSNQALNQLFQKIIALDLDTRHLLRLGHGEGTLETEASYGRYGRVESFLENRQFYLSEVNRLAASIGAEGAHGASCETAEYFNQVFIVPLWTQFWTIANGASASPEAVTSAFPFYKFFANAPVPDLFPPNVALEEARQIASGCEYHLSKIFSELASIRPFEILRSPRDQANHLLLSGARIIAMTSTHAAIRRQEIADLGFHYDTLIMEEAAQITEIESFIPLALQKPDKNGQLPIKRIVLVGDHLQNSPVIQSHPLREYSHFEQSLFLRLIRLGVPSVTLDAQGRCRPSLANLFSWRYPGLKNLPHTLTDVEFARANAGFRYDYQFINVEDYQGHGEREPTPHFIQNLGEAEYAVALFQYMRLLGYPASCITILATYAGQSALIKDVLNSRCKSNRLFGLPRWVGTVDKYQGEQNEFVILSLVRTKSVGYLRDVRRLTVALSRARLGLYILGRRDLWENCWEMRSAMNLLLERPDQLTLVTGEMYPTLRQVEQETDSTQMEGLEHLGQYVFEMTQAKVKALGGNIVLEGGKTEEDKGADDEEIELSDVVDGIDEDPLHEGA